MTNIIEYEELAWKNLLSNVVLCKEPVCSSQVPSTTNSFVDSEQAYLEQKDANEYLNSTLISPAIVYLAESNTSGLAMLVDKLLLEAGNNPSSKHLISALINRLHYNSISIKPTAKDDSKEFILKTIAAATRFTQVNEPDGPSNVKAAKLLTSAIQKFERNELDSKTLEYEWKEFLFHFYRSRLKEWAS
ncbi:MAG TPA: hypothetical protein VGP47_07185 [Parachlamydiaceae bacterium]|nr:hypothetical protein [Parachlamydiaceae bacterium]